MVGFGLSSFSSRSTFNGVPAARIDEIGDAGVVILGVPFDWGTTYRAGARFGPKAIRESDPLPPSDGRPHLDTGIDPLSALGVVDIGDVDVAPGYTDAGIELIRDAVRTVAASGAIPLVLGGDHTITFPNAAAVADVAGHGEVALIHFDAHADTAESQHGHLHGHGTPMRRLVESGAVPGHRFVQIGLRGYWPPPHIVDWMTQQGMRSYLMSDIARLGLDAVVDQAVEYAAEGTSGVFISVDIDVVDPGTAPGTGYPEPGGLTSRELLDTIRRLGRELNVLGADIVEVSPPYDTADITALLANRVAMEMLNGMAQRRGSPDA